MQALIEFIGRLALLIAICIAIYYACAPKPVFVIRFTPKGVKVTKGSPTRNFVSALIDLQQEFNLSKGKIIATTEDKRIRVEASKSLPPEIRQRVRNLWAVFG